MLIVAGLASACDDEQLPPDDGGPGDGDVDGGGDGGGGTCAGDDECDDGLFCNGEERCDPEAAGADERGCLVGNGDPCLESQECDESQERCLTVCDLTGDADGDGHRSTDCGGDDCDDSDLNRFPGNTEVCDLEDHDEDCNPTTFGIRDADGDGEPDADCCNIDDDGVATCGTDCDDTRSTVSPRSPEVCDGFDNNCDDEVDEGVLRTFYPDADGDGYGNPAGTTAEGCTPPEGYVEDDSDCDDSSRSINPAAAEVCDDVDNNCDGVTDVTGGVACPCVIGETRGCGEPDGAGDFIGEGECVVGTQRCIEGLWSECIGDVRPTFEECNGRDDDCDGAIDDEVMQAFYPDADGDNYGDSAGDALLACVAPAGYVRNNTDCDDSSRSRNPGLAEVCDRIHDNDCDDSTNHFDDDGDGFDDRGCGGDDCSDDDPLIHPGATERCNAVDDDCDGSIPDDMDGDGFAAAACGGDDCDDDEATAHPGGVERCANDIDEDCSGAVDDPTMGTWPGNYDVDDRADIERLIGFTAIDGNLSISTPDLTDLSGLECLETITGNLYVTDNSFLRSLNGLEGLTTLEGGLSIMVNPNLESLDGLANLPALGRGAEIWNNPSLSSLAGLSSLTTIAGTLRVTSNASMTTLGDLSGLTTASGLSVESNPTLTSLGNLSGLAEFSVGTDPSMDEIGLSISNNAVLPSLEGLALTTVPYIRISRNDALTSLEGLSGLTVVESSRLDGNKASVVTLDDNDALEDLEGLRNLTVLNGLLSIQRNDALTSVALPSLTTLEQLFIVDNDALVDLAGLTGLTSIGTSTAPDDGVGGAGLFIADNDALTSLSGLDNLLSVTADFQQPGVQIANNLALTTLTGLEGLTLVSGSVDISENNALTSLSALYNLATIGKNLSIYHNIALVTLGLSSLAQLGPTQNGSFIITDNTALPTCSAEALRDALFGLGWFGWSLIERNNDAGTCL